jgi:hypothetical protein
VLLVPESRPKVLSRALVRATFDDARQVFAEMPERTPVAPIELKFGEHDP